MARYSIIPSVLGALLLMAAPGQAEVVTRAEPAKPQAGGQTLGPAGPVRLVCYQEGQKIIDERGLYEFSLTQPGAVIVNFARQPNAQRAVSLVATDSATCLVQTER